jgi:hypothetical protein
VNPRHIGDRLVGVVTTTKTDRHDIAEILLKVALKHQTSKNQNHSLTYHGNFFHLIFMQLFS